MKKIALLAGLFTVSMWLAGCTGSMNFGWGVENTEFEHTAKPAHTQP